MCIIVPAGTKGGTKRDAVTYLAHTEVKGVHRAICFAATCLSTRQQNQPIEFLTRPDPTEVLERERNKNDNSFGYDQNKKVPRPAGTLEIRRQ